MATLATVITNDVTAATGIFKRTGDFAETVTYNAASITAQVFRAGTFEVGHDTGMVDQRKEAEVFVSKDEVSAPARGDTVVFDSETYTVIDIITEDADSAMLRVRETENQYISGEDWQDEN